MTPHLPYPAPPSPGPVGLGDVFTAVIDLYKAKWKLFVLVALAPALAAGLVALGYLLALAALGVTAFTRSTPAAAADLVVGIVVSVALFLLAMLGVTALQYKCNAMIALGAADLTRGRDPQFGDLWARTRGVALRALGVILALGLLVTVGYGLVIALFVGGASAFSGGRGTSNPPGWLVAFLVLFFLGVVVAAIVLSVRWLYFVPVLGIEGRPGFASLGRSWQLTRGEFWRTLGWYFVGSVVVGIPSMIVSGIGQALLLPESLSSDPDPARLVMPLSVTLVLSIAVTVFTAPLLELLRAVMYLDQVQRSEPTAARPVAWSQPFPAQPYPTQPYPTQAYPTQPSTPPPATPTYGPPERLDEPQQNPWSRPASVPPPEQPEPPR